MSSAEQTIRAATLQNGWTPVCMYFGSNLSRQALQSSVLYDKSVLYGHMRTFYFHSSFAECSCQEVTLYALKN